MACRTYFCGWHFKLQSDNQTLALIVAYHISGKQKSCSLQIITDKLVKVIELPYSQFRSEPKGFDVRIAGNRFSRDGISLNLHQDDIDLSGSITFGPWAGLDGDIMGPFRFVPFMECRHSVQSACHSVNGSVSFNGTLFEFNNAKGYIEGDRGYSFPSVYMWTQCLFDNGSLMLSVADIPMGLFHFTGLIGFVRIDGKEYRIATYKGARAREIKDGGCIIAQGNMVFTAKLLKKNDHPLLAPVKGSMVRTIRESASCTARYTFSIDGKTILDLTSSRASFEFEY